MPFVDLLRNQNKYKKIKKKKNIQNHTQKIKKKCAGNKFTAKYFIYKEPNSEIIKIPIV